MVLRVLGGLARKIPGALDAGVMRLGREGTGPLTGRFNDEQARESGLAQINALGRGLLANSGFSPVPITTGQALAAGIGEMDAERDRILGRSAAGNQFLAAQDLKERQIELQQAKAREAAMRAARGETRDERRLALEERRVLTGESREDRMRRQGPNVTFAGESGAFVGPASALQGLGLTPNQQLNQGRGIAEDQTPLDTALSARRALEDNPSAAGARGVFATNAVPLVRNLFGGALADPLAEALVGESSVPEIAATRTQLQAVTSQAARVLVDPTGRLSDRDQKLAESAMRLMTPFTDAAEAKAALRDFTALTLKMEMRIAENQNLPSRINVDTDEGLEELGQMLIDSGFSRAEAVDIAKELLR